MGLVNFGDLSVLAMIGFSDIYSIIIEIIELLPGIIIFMFILSWFRVGFAISFVNGLKNIIGGFFNWIVNLLGFGTNKAVGSALERAGITKESLERTKYINYISPFFKRQYGVKKVYKEVYLPEFQSDGEPVSIDVLVIHKKSILLIETVQQDNAAFKGSTNDKTWQIFDSYKTYDMENPYAILNRKKELLKKTIDLGDTPINTMLIFKDDTDLSRIQMNFKTEQILRDYPVESQKDYLDNLFDQLKNISNERYQLITDLIEPLTKFPKVERKQYLASKELESNQS